MVLIVRFSNNEMRVVPMAYMIIRAAAVSICVYPQTSHSHPVSRKFEFNLLMSSYILTKTIS